MDRINIDDVTRTASEFGDTVERRIYDLYESGEISYEQFKNLLLDIHRWELTTHKLMQVIEPVNNQSKVLEL